MVLQMSLTKCLRDLLQKDSFVYAISICSVTALPARPQFQAINVSGLWEFRSTEELCSYRPLCYRIIYMKLGLLHYFRLYLLLLHPPHLLSGSMGIHCLCQMAIKITEAT